MDEEARVVIGVPHIGDLPGYFVDSLCTVMSAYPHRFVLVRVERHPTDAARNMIVRAFLDTPAATHLFFMDADMTFPRETLQRLLSRDVPIVSGLYVARGDVPTPHIYDFSHADEKGRWYRSKVRTLADWVERHPEYESGQRARVYDDDGQSLVEVDAVGAGCLLIRRDALEAMEAPHFRFNEEARYGGEDFYFCRKACDAGLPVMADLSVHCGHLAPQFVGVADFADAFRVGQPEMSPEDVYVRDGEEVTSERLHA